MPSTSNWPSAFRVSFVVLIGCASVTTYASPLIAVIVPSVATNAGMRTSETSTPFKEPNSAPHRSVRATAGTKPIRLHSMQHSTVDHANTELADRSNSAQMMAVVIAQAVMP